MKTFSKWVKDTWVLLQSAGRVKHVFLLAAVVILGSTVLVAGVAIKSHNLPTMQVPTPSTQEESDNGEVAGVSDDALPEQTPTLTPVKARKVVPIATPTPTAAPASSNNQSQSNNNQPNNSSNNSNQQSQNNTNNQASSPTPTPTVTSTQEQTPTPTPDNTPFEASWTVSWSGDEVTGVVTANKPLKNCWFERWGGSLGVSGGGSISGNICTVSNNASGATPSTKFWMKVESTNGETKEFGDTPSSQSNAQI